jgi:5-aminolevulinate synthase
VLVVVYDSVLRKQISEVLIDRYGIYEQPINYPAVPRGTKLLLTTQGRRTSSATALLPLLSGKEV